MARKKRLNITWTGTPGGVPPPKPQILKLPLFRGTTDPPEGPLRKIWDDYLSHPGSLFRTTTGLVVEDLNPKQFVQPAYPVLLTYWPRGTQVIIQPYTMAIYAGAIRSEERSRNDATLRLIRHTFIIGTGCYIVPNLTSLEPVP